MEQSSSPLNPGLAISLSTLIGGAMGCVIGGYMADVVVQRVGLYARVLVMAVTQVRGKMEAKLAMR